MCFSKPDNVGISNHLRKHMIYSPCKDCKDRKIGCHEDCKEYLDYRAKIDATTENIKNEKKPSNA